jgi:hypothetical protein
LKSATFFTKFNALGTVSILFILFSVRYRSVFFLFPLVNLKSATFFTKFNALGTVSILFILLSVLYR